MASKTSLPRREIGAFCSELRRLRIRPERITLFGSWAQGVAHAGSDIDLIVVSRDFRGKGLRRRLELLGVAAARALVPIQALGYTPREIEEPEPGGLLHSILRGATPAVPVDISGPDVAIATASRRGGYS